MILWPQLGIQSTIILAIISGAYYFLKKYIDSAIGKYAEEKGKNQATKEDIGEITKIVKDIKSEFAKQTEELRAQLSLTNQHRLTWKSIEMNAMIEYNKRITAWLYAIARIDFTQYGEWNFKDLLKIDSEFNSMIYEVDMAEGHLFLFMYDDEVLQLKRNLSVAISNYQSMMLRFRGDIYYKLWNFDIEKGNIGDPEMLEDYRTEYLGSLQRDISSINKTHFSTFAEVHKLHVDLIKSLSSRLKTLSEA